MLEKASSSAPTLHEGSQRDSLLDQVGEIQAQIALIDEQREFIAAEGPKNDSAEFRIYGSRGRTYLDGSGNIIANQEKTTPGRIEQIKGDEDLDPNPKVRLRLAKGYERDINLLTAENGLSLYQAEKIAEARLADRKKILHLTARFMDGDKNGSSMDYESAHKKAKDVYRKIDARRVHEALLDNPFTRNEEESRYATEKQQEKLQEREKIKTRESERQQNKQKGRQRAKDIAQGRTLPDNTDDIYNEAHALNAEYDASLMAIPHLKEKNSGRLIAYFSNPDNSEVVKGEILSRYANVSGRRRSGFLGRLQQGGHFGRRLNRKSQEVDQEINDARTAYVNAMKQWANVYRRANGDKASEVKLMKNSLAGISLLQNATSSSRLDYAKGSNNLRDKAAIYIGRKWADNRTGRFFKVALPAVALGAAIPGFGVILGRKYGQAVASAESRRRVVDKDYREKLLNAEEDDFAKLLLNSEGAKLSDLKIDNLMANDKTVDDYDFTKYFENTTEKQIQQNRRRREIAGRVGTIAAAAGSAVTIASGVSAGVLHPLIHGASPVHHAAVKHHPVTHPGSSNGKPTPRGGNGNGSKFTPRPHGGSKPATGHSPEGNPLEVNPNQYPWNVAHRLSPGHEMQVMRHTMHSLNEKYGSHLHFVAQPNGTIWIENGSHALSPSQQIGFNSYMETLLHA